LATRRKYPQNGEGTRLRRRHSSQDQKTNGGCCGLIGPPAEGHAGMPARLDAWLHQRDATGSLIPFYYIPQVPKAVSRESEAAKFVAAIGAKTTEGAALVVIDTMARSIVGLDENSTEAASAYLDMTDYFVRELGCTCLTIAHASNKDQKNPKLWNKDADPDFRGSSGFGAGYDTTWTMLKSDRGSIVRLQPKWSKNHELSDLTTFYLTLTPVQLPDGRKGATLELCDKTAYDASWPLNAAEAAAREKACEEIDAVVLVNEMHTALKRLGACPGGSLAWRDQDATVAGAWSDAVPASGGVNLNTLAIQILKDRGNNNPGSAETDSLKAAIRQGVKNGEAIALYHVEQRKGRYGGQIFAIRS
jgi:AAA domain